jgi:predicted alpha/beta hydrolase
MREPEGFARLSTVGPVPMTLTCDDGFKLAATCFEAAGTPRAIIVLAGALGLQRRFYGRFAEFMSSQGVAVLTFDYRGMVESPPGVGQETLVDFERWGRLDIDAAIRSAAALYPGLPIHLVGHSCGGQLFGLAQSSTLLAGAVLVAATLPHPSRYPRPDRYALWLIWRVLAPIFTLGAGHRPGRLPGLSGAIAPKRVLQQWSKWCRRKDYLFDPRWALDTGRFAQLSLPMLVIGMSDDEQAPEPAVAALAQRFPQAEIERRLVDARQMGFGSVGHLGYFRAKHRDALWFPLLSWILRHRPAEAPPAEMTG